MRLLKYLKEIAIDEKLAILGVFLSIVQIVCWTLVLCLQ